MYTHPEHRRTDFKLKSHIHIIETKCLSEFEILNAIGEENSGVKACTYTNTV